jgi:hypothetical protein
LTILSATGSPAAALSTGSFPDAAQEAAIDPQRSTITIHVGKAGIFSVAGHEHWVNAPISSGVIRESPAPQVEFTIETAKMTVKPDPKVDAKTQVRFKRTCRR